jgi:hypothetical protein
MRVLRYINTLQRFSNRYLTQNFAIFLGPDLVFEANVVTKYAS